jgi:hypothetical protein
MATTELRREPKALSHDPTVGLGSLQVMPNSGRTIPVRASTRDEPNALTGSMHGFKHTW